MTALIRGIRCRATLILIALCAIVIVLTYTRGEQLGMKDRLSTQFAWYYVPIALTYLNEPGRLSYAANATRMDLFVRSYFKDQDFEAALREANKAAVYPPTWFIWGNDKGGVLYSIAAFRLFGQHADSHYNLFFLLLSASAAIFALSFRKDPFKLFCLFCLLLSLYVLAKPFSQGGLQLGGFQAQRSLCVLALIPTLHLLFTVSARLTFGGAMAILAQAAMIVFAYFIRSTAAWAFIGVGIFTLFLVVRDRRRVLESLPRWRQRAGILTLGAYLFPLIALTGALGVLHIHKQTTFHQRYLTDLQETRVLWHNIYMGTVVWLDLLRSPDTAPLARELFPTGRFGDDGVKDSLEVYLKRTGRATQWKAMIEPVNKGLIGNIYSLTDYERFVRAMYFDAWRQYPDKLLAAYLIRKPTAYLKLFADLWKPTEPNYDIAGLGIYYGRYYDGAALHVLPLILFLSATALLVILRQPVARRSMAAVLTIALIPQLGWILAYPIFSATPEAFLALTFFLYIAAALLVLWGVLFVSRLNPSRHPAHRLNDQVGQGIKGQAARAE